ncbi:MAG: L-histidine N(alpha)-methyltransferase [bacterium]|nr:L-histidine N(alpha)-methyltransferase [bacterium]
MPESTPSEAAPADFETSSDLHTDLDRSVQQLLLDERPSIPPRFLYDELGSRLFEVITALPDYYPTRTEAALLESSIADILAARPVAGSTMIDLGAGNCAKAAALFEHARPAHYVAVDVSADFLEQALSQLRPRFPDIEMTGVGTDFSQLLDLPAGIAADPRLFFYPGSSIGNFSRSEAIEFLKSVRAAMGPESTLWITADLDKDPAVLERAYDDELGVTAAFNRNVLLHLNRVAKTDFELADWRHVAHYDRAAMRIQMHLETIRATTVHWPGGERRFAKGDRLHTENSHKYTVESFSELLAIAGLRTVEHWTAPEDWMGFFVAAPA